MKNDFDDEKPDKWEPSKKDMDDLEVALKVYPQNEINGKLVSPFDQYLKSLGVIRFDENMNIVCRDVEGHNRLSKINGRLEYRQAMQDEALFQEFPEERKLFVEGLDKMRSKFRV